MSVNKMQREKRRRDANEGTDFFNNEPLEEPLEPDIDLKIYHLPDGVVVFPANSTSTKTTHNDFL